MSNIKVFNLPAADLIIDLGYGISLTGIRRVTGSVFDCIMADVLTPELNKSLPVTYEANTDNAILHEWYSLDDWLEREYIRQAVREFLQSCAA